MEKINDIKSSSVNIISNTTEVTDYHKLNPQNATEFKTP
tara:strand:- start:7628 stop:7744 length:117 start_codon:yes stop_codon:yes gene_type:complete